jgi:hypothetical protein
LFDQLGISFIGPVKQILGHEVNAWHNHRNKHHAKANWQFKTAEAFGCSEHLTIGDFLASPESGYSLNLSQNTPTAIHGLNRTSRYAGGSNFVSLDFVSDALPLPESERRVAWPLERG